MSKGDKEIRKLIFPRHYYLLPMQPSLVQNCLPSLFGTSNDANEEVTRSDTRNDILPINTSGSIFLASK